MAWVPIHLSSVAYTFEAMAPDASTMTDSTVSFSAGSGVLSDWRISFSPSYTGQVRITTQSYLAGTNRSGLDYEPALFSSAEGTVTNEAPPYPDAQYPDDSGVTAFSPSPVTITSPGSLIDYACTLSTSEQTYDDISFEFLVEVFEADAVSYNCECDDEYPTRTLAQMREYLMIRLGWGAMVSTPLPGVAATLNSFLRDAQEQIYRQYKVFRLERFFTWQLLTGVRFYDIPENEDVCTKKLDPRMITWVGISEGDNFWRQLVCGIKPEFYYGDISSWPTHYEIRQCIEVWPPPSSDDWKLRIKGYFGLLPLEVDTDVNTIDYEAIQLFALANAKAHYGQPDAANYMGQYRDYIGAVTAGSHHTRRYVPNTEQSYPPPLPILTGYPGDP